ncbi:hypothetical protein [Sinorhizobium psoraleae]|uniref:Uncharacterized protein n=1 Tax=Sinorhizobium psoraleae TaxID=520838 RepID=A0ABT4KB44_9HYPH|nr:hypothetical protein [Sinorhizobium psoraleae]MCZ4089182.1 hypothetical protein [Sinorhizobium psoraleae]
MSASMSLSEDHKVSLPLAFGRQSEGGVTSHLTHSIYRESCQPRLRLKLSATYRFGEFGKGFHDPGAGFRAHEFDTRRRELFEPSDVSSCFREIDLVHKGSIGPSGNLASKLRASSTIRVTVCGRVTSDTMIAAEAPAT